VARDIDQSLAAFKEQDLTVRVCQTLFGAVPGAPPFVLYSDLAGALRRVDPAAGPDLLARARQVVQTPEIDRALWASDALDTADMGLAGTRLFRGPLESSLEQARGSIDELPGRLRGLFATALNVLDSAAGTAASGLDAIPVWRFLGPRLLAEACARRALRA
jgi:hypothetical protein